MTSKGGRDASIPVSYRPPTPSEVSGGDAELFMFVLMILGFAAVMMRMKILIWVVIFASISHWSSSISGVDADQQKPVMSLVGFIAMGLVTIYLAPQPKARPAATT